jgi:N-acetylglucosaminyl-diphospho-decaprenol L-rhamnosyltransferase
MKQVAAHSFVLAKSRPERTINEGGIVTLSLTKYQCDVDLAFVERIEIGCSNSLLEFEWTSTYQMEQDRSFALQKGGPELTRNSAIPNNIATTPSGNLDLQLRGKMKADVAGMTSFTPVIIVSFRTPSDLAASLRSLDTLRSDSDLAIYICENGGSAAWRDLCSELLRPDSPCVPATDVDIPAGSNFSQIACFRLRQSGRRVLVGDAPENLGYAGGINSWLYPLMSDSQWNGCWILNPDTQVEAGALVELIDQAKRRNLDMVGSRIMLTPADTHVACWGLGWRRVAASGYFLGQDKQISIEPDPETLEPALEAATGASCYWTRSCAEALVPLDERYFLFFEDFDWGARARRRGYRVGYAHNSIVFHSGGNSVGSPSHGAIGSPLAVYLGFRNRLLFVRSHYPVWWIWTVLVSWLHAFRVIKRGRFKPAALGIFAGIRGETGRPDWLVAEHKVRGPREAQKSPAP